LRDSLKNSLIKTLLYSTIVINFGDKMNRSILTILLFAAAIPTFADNKTSVELIVGKADQDTETGSTKITSGDDTSIGIRGSYFFNKNLAFELSYQSYGETDDVRVDSFGDTIHDKIKTTAFNLGLKGILPIENGFSIHGRLGLSSWDWELSSVDSSMPGFVFESDDNGTDFYYGLGLQFDIDDNFFAGAEYTIMELDVDVNSFSIDHKVSNLSAFVGYKF
jgi:opacity protein-like surface antigen